MKRNTEHLCSVKRKSSTSKKKLLALLMLCSVFFFPFCLDLSLLLISCCGILLWDEELWGWDTYQLSYQAGGIIKHMCTLRRGKEDESEGWIATQWTPHKGESSASQKYLKLISLTRRAEEEPKSFVRETTWDLSRHCWVMEYETAVHSY